MGASKSRLEEDKGLQLCRTRKKLIKQALNGRCSLAAAHISYIEELKMIGSALRSFMEADYQDESPRNPAPELHVRSPTQQVNSTADVLSSPSASVSSDCKSHHVKFRSKPSIKVEEHPPAVVIAPFSSASPPSTTPRSVEGLEVSPVENTSIPLESAPWDYFGLSHSIDNKFSVEEQKKYDQDEAKHIIVDDDAPKLEDVKGNEIEESSQFSEAEFDEPASSTLVRSFENINKTKTSDLTLDASEGREPEINYFSTENVNETKENLGDGDSSIRSSEDLILGTKFVKGNKRKSPDLSPLRATSSTFVHLNDVKIRLMENSEVEDNVVPKDFISSVKHIEQIFVKASESGKEVPRMLEANKFHFRPVLSEQQRGFFTISFLKSCFFCGMDPSETPREPHQNSVKYLTWHRSASSRNLLGANSIDNGDLGSNLFENSCMNSGSHASTLDRLYAWEKKLYDEVKAAQVLRNAFDQKCKILRQLEARGEHIDKTRAVVKDLHSRIGVAIHRINSISKKIEEIRDTELQQQLEELIEGLLKMWERMLDCHKLQHHIASVSRAPCVTTFSMQSDHRRQMAIHLENELTTFLSTFTKWINVQKLYVETIDRWLLVCVSVPQKTSKRNKRMRALPIRHCGPPIYMMCDVWIKMMNELPSKEVAESVKELSAEVANLVPRQERKMGNRSDGIRSIFEERPTLDRFQMRLVDFLGKLSSFAEACVLNCAQVQKAIQDSKNNYQCSSNQASLYGMNMMVK